MTPDLYDVHNLIAAGWEPYDLQVHHQKHGFWVEFLLYESCTTSYTTGIGYRLSRSLSVRPMRECCVQLVSSVVTCEFDQKKSCQYVHTWRFAPRAASAARYARSQGRIEQNANKANRDVLDFRCKLTTCKWQALPCSMKTTRTSHACTKYIEQRAERKSGASC